MSLQRWTNGLLAATVGVFAVNAVLVVGAVGPPWLWWTLLGGACGLLTLVWLLEAGAAVWRKAGPAFAASRRSRRTTGDWAQAWEELMRKPVH